MPGYDYYMFSHYGCNMQFGGDDQWSNMLGGTEADPPWLRARCLRYDRDSALTDSQN